jgi:carboxylesterase
MELPPLSDDVGTQPDTRPFGADDAGFAEAGAQASAVALRRPFYFAGDDERRVLLVHGFTGTPFEMRPLGEHLARAGFTVYAPRLEGHGTTSEALLATRAADWIRTVDDALARLLGDGRVAKIYVCGLSLGGLLTLDLARRRPEVVAALTAIATPLWLTLASELAIRVTRRLGGPPNFVLPKMAGSDIADPTLRRLNDRAQGSVGLPLPSVVSLHELAGQVKARLGEVRAPALCIHARKDHVAPYACLEALVRGLGSAGSIESLTLERSFHVSTLDYDRDTIFAAVAAHAERAFAARSRPLA